MSGTVNLDMEKLSYQWLAGYDEDKEPDERPEWAEAQGIYHAGEDEESRKWKSDTLTIFNRDVSQDAYVKSDTYVSLDDNR